jgi:tripartite-type tricarboxylate transporter receptor subunit TctC
VAPAKTPLPIVERLHGALMNVVVQPGFKNQIVNGGMLPMDNPSREGLQDFVNAEILRWGAVVRRAGLAGSE